MKSRLYIIPLIIIYFILCGKSCVDDDARNAWQKNEAEAARDSIRSEFEVDYLAEEGRYTAGIKAVQELKDLADYVEIYTDLSIDSLFRQKAGEMIRDIFNTENARLSFGQMKNKKMKSVTLDEFLKTGFGDDMKKAEVIFDSIRVLEPLQKSDESTYSGKLAAFQTIKLYPSADSVHSSSKQIIVNFISAKQAKIIGTDTLMVWEVSLGGLE